MTVLGLMIIILQPKDEETFRLPDSSCIFVTISVIKVRNKKGKGTSKLQLSLSIHKELITAQERPILKERAAKKLNFK